MSETDRSSDASIFFKKRTKHFDKGYLIDSCKYPSRKASQKRKVAPRLRVTYPNSESWAG